VYFSNPELLQKCKVMTSLPSQITKPLEKAVINFRNLDINISVMDINTELKTIIYLC